MSPFIHHELRGFDGVAFVQRPIYDVEAVLDGVGGRGVVETVDVQIDANDTLNGLAILFAEARDPLVEVDSVELNELELPANFFVIIDEAVVIIGGGGVEGRIRIRSVQSDIAVTILEMETERGAMVHAGAVVYFFQTDEFDCGLNGKFLLPLARSTEEKKRQHQNPESSHRLKSQLTPNT